MLIEEKRSAPDVSGRSGLCAPVAARRFAGDLLRAGGAVVFLSLLTAPALAGPDPCETEGTTATCSGNQSSGIRSGVDFSTPPVTTLNVHSLAGAIAPVTAGRSGIWFFNDDGQYLTVNGGSANDVITIDTTAAGNGAAGIFAGSVGQSPYPPYDPLLRVWTPGGNGNGDDPGFEAVRVDNYSDITTNGMSAHGIYGISYTTGLPGAVRSTLEDFKADYEAGAIEINYAVSGVRDADGTEVGTETEVAGERLYLVPSPGCDVVSDPECRIDPEEREELEGTGGTFIIHDDGTFSFDPGTDFDALAVGYTETVAVTYQMTGTRDGTTETGITARLFATVTMTESGLAPILFRAVFDKYGSSGLPATEGTVMPDLIAYADRLIEQTQGGGAGQGVTINHLAGSIFTHGLASHGIWGESYGLNGRSGRNGGGFFSFGSVEPTRGSDGRTGGTVAITSEAAITTGADRSAGVFAYSRGGTGGTGGSGGTWYGGRRGGDGGVGGDANVYGGSTIDTFGSYSSGILAFSVGGTGGDGGDGGFAAGGARGGYGGNAGAVEVVGDWDITTQGAYAHGIWAKSLGGAAGPGGDDGWIYGGAGGGGQGADGGLVTVDSNGSIETWSHDAFGIHAQSIGGFGGSGGTGISIFAAAGGDGGSAGSGGDVDVVVGANGEVVTHGVSSHAIFAQSIGGGGGSGGGSGAIFVSHGGDGGAGGRGGSVTIHNWGRVETFNLNARGVFAQSIGGGGGDGGFAGGLYGSGGSGSGASDAGSVEVVNGSEILTHGLFSDAIFAQSVGGGGGSGGAAAGLVSIGGSAGGGGSGRTVDVSNEGLIHTGQSFSRGIFAQSVGGGGGDGAFAGGLVALGGDAGTAGNGGTVNVSNSGDIQTDLWFSQGIFAQSVGGGGGSGGGSAAWFASLGGTGGGGGTGGNVFVDNNGLVETFGLGSQAVFAQSVGGGGGNGGGSGGFFTAFGGDAGDGSRGGDVDVDNSGTVRTHDNFSVGVFAQSVGGGGGNGAGSGGWFASMGGTGGDSGVGGVVDVWNGGLIDTSGAWSHGVFAQSIGGGGGSGGGSGSVWVAIGGRGGTGNDAGEVIVDNSGAITTTGLGARGVHAESIGGGGGSGGGAGALNIAIGGGGNAGGEGGTVEVINEGNIETTGHLAQGIFAHSVGGGGGSGGSTGSLFVSVGGDGDAGGDGGIVEVTNSGTLTTHGSSAIGIFAQSVGGGGGNGGSATTIAPTGPIALGFAIGGGGGVGGDGRLVDVSNTGRITVEGSNSHGVFAQSVGGGGGSGGTATTVTVNFPIPEVEVPTIGAAVAIGGGAGNGGGAGEVVVDNSGEITTISFRSYGVHAQSVGGGGGDGGNATSVLLSLNADFGANVAIGGDAGNAGDGNRVTVDNTGSIHTVGDQSTAVLAQSVGGGGGAGGDAMAINVSLDVPLGAEDLIPTPSGSFTMAIGGAGGNGGTGDEVVATNAGYIFTEGNFANGVTAQSIGGGGGIGGDSKIIDVELSANPTDFIPWADSTSFDMTLNFGGSGGSGNHGGIVIVTNDRGLGDDHGIVTTGVFSHGIVAQSVGGGGGAGGAALEFEFSNTDLPIEDIPGLGGGLSFNNFSMTLQGSGGGGGDGGNVTVNSHDKIVTEGDHSMGIVAQSIAGGGGLAGLHNPLGTTDFDLLDAMTGLLFDGEVSLSFAGSAGGDGTAGDVAVHHTGSIQTAGMAAHGVFAQSATGAGATGTTGDVTVTLNGSITTMGDHSYGIYAQSGGGTGNGDIALTIEGGTVQGGGGSGAGIYIADGNGNAIENSGHITSVPGVEGHAVIAGNGHEFIENHGIMTGSVYLGGGTNLFENYGVLNTGADYQIGAGNLLLNAGDLAPGGTASVYMTSVLGDLVQTGSGTLWVDLDFEADTADWLDISGSAELGGAVALLTMNAGRIMPGEHEIVIVTGADGIVDNGLTLEVAPSAVVRYALEAPGATERSVHYSVDFAPGGLNGNQAAIGAHINDIQSAGGSDAFEPIAEALFYVPDAASLADAYDRLSPESIAQIQLSSLLSSMEFGDALMSCRARDGQFRFVGEAECAWMALSLSDVGWEGDAASLPFTEETIRVAGGFQRAVGERWHAGLGMSLEDQASRTGSLARTEGMRGQAGFVLKGSHGANTIAGAVTGGFASFDTRRAVELPTSGVEARADHNLSFLAARLRWARAFEWPNRYLKPGVDLGLTHLEVSGFQESGAGGANLVVRGRSESYLSVSPALEFGGEMALANGTLLRPFAKVGLTHFLSGSDPAISAVFDGAPVGVAPFTVATELDDSFLDAGLGIDVLGPAGTVIRLNYAGRFSDRVDSHGMFLRLSIPL